MIYVLGASVDTLTPQSLGRGHKELNLSIANQILLIRFSLQCLHSTTVYACKLFSWISTCLIDLTLFLSYIIF